MNRKKNQKKTEKKEKEKKKKEKEKKRHGRWRKRRKKKKKRKKKKNREREEKKERKKSSKPVAGADLGVEMLHLFCEPLDNAAQVAVVDLRAVGSDADEPLERDAVRDEHLGELVDDDLGVLAVGAELHDAEQDLARAEVDGREEADVRAEDRALVRGRVCVEAEMEEAGGDPVVVDELLVDVVQNLLESVDAVDEVEVGEVRVEEAQVELFQRQPFGELLLRHSLPADEPRHVKLNRRLQEQEVPLPLRRTQLADVDPGPPVRRVFRGGDVRAG
jgi:hypothetical protein